MSILATILLLVSQTASNPDRVVVAGSVVDADGKPAVDVTIALGDDVPILPEILVTRASAVVLRPAAALRRERSGTGGEFRVELPETEWTGLQYRRPFALWAVGPGGSLAMRPIPGGWPADGVPIRMTLARPESMRFLVLDPEGSPVAGVRLLPARIRGVNLPDEVAERIAATTDAQGRATLATGLADEIEILRATSPAIGTQRIRMPGPGADGVRTIPLFPVGRIVGRIEAGDPAAVRSVAIRLRTDPDPADFVSGVGGVAEVVSDARGRFEVPAIAAGKLAFSIEARPDLPWRPGMLDRPTVAVGSAVDLTIPLRKATRVTGVVRSDPDGKPVAGAGVVVPTVATYPGDSFATTDEEGRFSALVVGTGRIYAYVAVAPRGYGIRTSAIRDVRSVDASAAEVTIDPARVVPAAEVRGRVVDPKGNPVPGAEIAGFHENPDAGEELIHVVADREGRFRIDHVPAHVKVELSASRGESVTAAPAMFTAGGEPITLTIGPGHSVALIGRVKDTSSRPIAGATIRVSARKFGGRQVMPIEQITVAFDDEGRTIVRSGPDGRFRTPRHLRPDMQYRVEAEADGYAPATTEWIAATDRAFQSFPPVVLQPILTTRTVFGRVVDSGGRPVAGVSILQSGDGPARTRATTGPDGRFRLPGVYRGPAFLFVEGDGWAFEGHRIGPEDGSVVLKARRVGEPAGPRLQTLPPLLPRDQEIALGRRLLDKEMGRLLRPGNRNSLSVLHPLARLDPDRAQDLVEKHAAPMATFWERLSMECALARLPLPADEASAVADSQSRPRIRSWICRQASDALPATDRAGKLALLDRAIVHARAETAPDGKLFELGLIGQRLLDQGEVRRGTEILREGQKLAGTIPKAQSVRVVFAAKLARIDAPAALALARESDQPNQVTYQTHVALVLADRDPATSERIFKESDGVSASLLAARAAGRMAKVDRDRARRLADWLTPPMLRVAAMVLMARSLAETDPKAAILMIDEALRRFEELERSSESPALRAYINATALLPIAERIDPELLRRCFWKVVALRPSRPAGGDPSGTYENAVARLALGLARYDRSVARQVLEPAISRVRSIEAGSSPLLRGMDVFTAAAAIDPTWAAMLADSLSDNSAGESKCLARLAIADAIADEGPARWEHYSATFERFTNDSRDNE